MATESTDTEAEAAEEAFAEQMLDESLEAYAGILPVEELKALRGVLRDELLFHPAGRARLKRAMAAPIVDESHVKAKDGGNTADTAKKEGSGA